VCNPYSITINQAAILALFQLLKKLETLDQAAAA
jgi:hypothetical protein